MAGVHRITLPDGCVINWRRIHRDYNEQIEGQRYDRSRVAADLQKKRAAFEEVATAAWLTRRGFSPHITGKILGEFSGDAEFPRERQGITITSWMWGGRLPQIISLKRHEYHQGSRVPVRLRASRKYELGYLTGLSSSGGITVNVNPQTGKSRLAVFTPSPGIVKEFSKAAKGAFGLKTWISRPPKNKPHQRQRLRASVDSTNLVRSLSPLFRNGASALDYLPNNPQARLGFTRAICDKGSTRIDMWEKSKRVAILHDDPRVLRIVSQALQEQGVPHVMTTYRGKKCIHIPHEGLPAFRRRIGFRDQQRQDKLPG